MYGAKNPSCLLIKIQINPLLIEHYDLIRDTVVAILEELNSGTLRKVHIPVQEILLYQQNKINSLFQNLAPKSNIIDCGVCYGNPIEISTLEQSLVTVLNNRKEGIGIMGVIGTNATMKKPLYDIETVSVSVPALTFSDYVQIVRGKKIPDRLRLQIYNALIESNNPREVLTKLQLLKPNIRSQWAGLHNQSIANYFQYVPQGISSFEKAIFQIIPPLVSVEHASVLIIPKLVAILAKSPALSGYELASQLQCNRATIRELLQALSNSGICNSLPPVSIDREPLSSSSKKPYLQLFSLPGLRAIIAKSAHISQELYQQYVPLDALGAMLHTTISQETSMYSEGLHGILIKKKNNETILFSCSSTDTISALAARIKKRNAQIGFFVTEKSELKIHPLDKIIQLPMQYCYLL
ncbi:MAG: HTH domain-containing protein [Methylacidiphilales bacterium]|nr:HTH domain-containing protein [Candidatus Methylacidiphilales bacterium]